MSESKHNNIPLTYSIDESFDNDKFLKLRLKICHNARSLHNTKFKLSALEKAENTISNIPILAHVIENNEGELDLGGHDIEIEVDRYNDNKFRAIYLEQPVGVIPETNNYEIVEEDGISYVYCDGYIWKGYSNYCIDILENNSRIKLSMEVDFDEMHYSQSDDCYIVSDFKYLGITLLGSNCRPAMQNSGADITSYSIDDNNKNIVTVEELRSEIYKAISANSEVQKKGVDNMDLETKQKILDEYGVTESDLNFEIADDMSENDFRTKLDEYVASKNEIESITDSEDVSEVAENAEVADTNSVDEPEVVNQNNSTEEIVEEKHNYYSVDNKTILFAMSDEDKRESIYRALSEVSDDEYWIMQTYEDYVIAQSWIDGRYYKIGFTKTDSGVMLDSDWVEVFAEFVTNDEKTELEKLRGDYNTLESEVNELREYKAQAEAEARTNALDSLFEKFDDELSESVEYLNLKKENSEYTVEQIEEKCYALIGKLNSKFSVGTGTTLLSVGYHNHVTQEEEKKEPYGGLMSLLNK